MAGESKFRVTTFLRFENNPANIAFQEATYFGLDVNGYQTSTAPFQSDTRFKPVSRENTSATIKQAVDQAGYTLILRSTGVFPTSAHANVLPDCVTGYLMTGRLLPKISAVKPGYTPKTSSFRVITAGVDPSSDRSFMQNDLNAVMLDIAFRRCTNIFVCGSVFTLESEQATRWLNKCREFLHALFKRIARWHDDRQALDKMSTLVSDEQAARYLSVLAMPTKRLTPERATSTEDVDTTAKLLDDEVVADLLHPDPPTPAAKRMRRARRVTNKNLVDEALIEKWKQHAHKIGGYQGISIRETMETIDARQRYATGVDLFA